MADFPDWVRTSKATLDKFDAALPMDVQRDILTYVCSFLDADKEAHFRETFESGARRYGSYKKFANGLVAAGRVLDVRDINKGDVFREIETRPGKATLARKDGAGWFVITPEATPIVDELVEWEPKS